MRRYLGRHGGCEIATNGRGRDTNLSNMKTIGIYGDQTCTLEHTARHYSTSAELSQMTLR